MCWKDSARYLLIVALSFGFVIYCGAQFRQRSTEDLASLTADLKSQGMPSGQVESIERHARSFAADVLAYVGLIYLAGAMLGLGTRGKCESGENITRPSSGPPETGAR